MSTRAEILPLPETPVTLVVCLIMVEAVIWIVLDRFTGGKYMSKVKSVLKVLRPTIRYTGDAAASVQV